MTDSPASRLAAIAERLAQRLGAVASDMEHAQSVIFHSGDREPGTQLRKDAVASDLREAAALLSRLAESERRNGELEAALKRAGRLIDWMAGYVGKMAPGSYGKCYADLNEHFLYMEARALTAKGERPLCAPKDTDSDP